MINDRDELHNVIEKFCDTHNTEHLDLFKLLEVHMWKSGRGRRTQVMGEFQNYGLIPIAAANKEGVPEHGAIRCLEYLLAEYGGLWSQDQLEIALERANELNRTTAVELLENYNQN